MSANDSPANTSSGSRLDPGSDHSSPVLGEDVDVRVIVIVDVGFDGDGDDPRRRGLRRAATA